MAGQPFTISGTATTGGFGSLYHGSGCSVVNSITNVFDPSPGSFIDSFPGQPAGSYSFSHEGDASGCVNFTVNSPPPIPEYPLGLPILGILIVIGYGLVRRRTRIISYRAHEPGCLGDGETLRDFRRSQDADRFLHGRNLKHRRKMRSIPAFCGRKPAGSPVSSLPIFASPNGAGWRRWGNQPARSATRQNQVAA